MIGVALDHVGLAIWGDVSEAIVSWTLEYG